jgi:four helix bundle protein
MGKIESFRQLEARQKSHRLALIVCQETKAFPSDERFGLVAQMRRAVISKPANIVEGFKRRRIQDKPHFYNISEGSLEEVKYYCILSKGLDYISSSDDLTTQSETIGRLLNGLIRSTENRL